MRKKIMFVMNQMTSGGAERVVSVLANKMVEDGNDISLVITFESEIHYCLNENIKIKKFNIDKYGSQIKRNIEEIYKLIDIFKEENPDIIISFIRNVNTIIAAKISGKKVIISERNNPKYDPKSKVWRIARKVIYPYADGIVFQSEGAKRFFNNTIQNKSCIIYNPLEPNIPLKTDKYLDTKKIVNVGRLCNQKDQETLLKAFSKFTVKYPEYNLIIYGEGELRGQLEDKIEKLGLNQKVLLPGSVKNIHEKIIDADVFVLSSIYEGYPNALIEAMAIGLPVISTMCEYGPNEIIKNEYNGILVPIKSSIQMYEQLSRIISNQELRKKIGKNAMEIRKNLDVDIIVKQWYEYIYKVIGKK